MYKACDPVGDNALRNDLGGWGGIRRSWLNAFRSSTIDMPFTCLYKLYIGSAPGADGMSGTWPQTWLWLVVATRAKANV